MFYFWILLWLFLLIASLKGSEWLLRRSGHL